MKGDSLDTALRAAAMTVTRANLMSTAIQVASDTDSIDGYLIVQFLTDIVLAKEKAGEDEPESHR